MKGSNSRAMLGQELFLFNMGDRKGGDTGAEHDGTGERGYGRAEGPEPRTGAAVRCPHREVRSEGGRGGGEGRGGQLQVAALCSWVKCLGSCL